MKTKADVRAQPTIKVRSRARYAAEAMAAVGLGTLAASGATTFDEASSPFTRATLCKRCASVADTIERAETYDAQRNAGHP